MKIKLYLPLFCILLLPIIAHAQCGNRNPGGPGGSGPQDPNGPPPGKGDPVNIYTGNEYQNVIDLDVWGAVGKLPFNFSRWSNSRAVSGTSVLGQGHYFRHNFQWDLATTRADSNGRARVIVINPEGAEYTYTQVSPDLWRTTAAGTDVLIPVAEGLALVRPDGTKYRFTASTTKGKTSYALTTIDDAHGLTTTLSYNPAKALSLVTEPAGRSLTLDYENRSINAVDFSTLATLSTAPASGQWVELTTTSTTAFRYVRLLSADLAYARFAEIEFYEASTGNRLTGTLISPDPAGEANLALDGNPATSYISPAQSGSFIGYDLGSAKKIGRVRFLMQSGHEAKAKPSAWSTSAVRLQGSNQKPGTVLCLKTVTSSDGRSVTYNYTDFTDPTVPYIWPVLSSVSYDDGTQATYTYGQIFPSQRPLVVEYDLPRYTLSQPRAQTVYKNERSNAVLGMVDKQVNIITGGTLLKVGVYKNDLHRPTATYADGSFEWQQETNGLVTSETDRLGRKTTYAYDANGFVTSRTDPLGRTTLFAVDSQGRVLKTTYPDNTSESRTYDPVGLELTHTDTLGHVTSITRDERRRITAISHPDGTVQRWTYNTFNQPVASTRRDGSTESWSYDGRGLLVGHTDSAGAVTRFTYNSSDRVATQIDAAGRVTSYAYNPRGQITGITYPDGSQLARAYDRYGNLIQVTDELGAVTSHTYDQFKRLTTTTDPLGRTSTVTYPPDHLNRSALTAIAPSGRTITYTYDSAWNELSRTVASGTPDAATTRTAYDEVYRVTQITDPAGNITRQTYDLRDRIVTVTDPLNRVTTSAYDALGRLTSLRRADGATTTYAYDAADRLVLTNDALGQATSQAYDGAGRLVRLTDPKGNVTTWSYDLPGRLIRKTYADGSGESYTYDLLSRRLSFTTRANVVASYAYDNRDRLLNTDWSDTTPDSTRSYDATGRLLALTTAGVSTHTYTYNAAGQLLSETTAPVALAPTTFTVGYAYDLDGRRSQLTYPDTSVVTYDYTPRGQLSAISADGPPPLATFAYDLLGRRTQKKLENGTATTYSYDVASQLTTLAHRNAASVELARFVYGYDIGGRRTAKTITGTAALTQAEAYGYDAIDQIISANYGTTQADTFAYDPMGNRTFATRTTGSTTSATAYTANSLNQYTAVNATAPTYDANGNTLSLGAQTFGYDGQSRLTSTQITDWSSSVTHTASFIYDAHNRQVNRTVDGVTTWFVWDNWSLLAEYRLTAGTPTLAARYVHGPRLDEILLQESPGQALPTAYLHEDGLGSTYLLSNPSGTIVERYTYTAFGEVSATDHTGASISNPSTRFLYTGREWLSQVGLNDHRNRFYLPSLGRWLSRDPIGENGGINLYGYVENNPIIYYDPLGLFNWSKGLVGMINIGRSVVKVAAGGAQIVTGVAAITAGIGTGVVTPWSVAAEVGGLMLRAL